MCQSRAIELPHQPTGRTRTRSRWEMAPVHGGGRRSPDGSRAADLNCLPVSSTRMCVHARVCECVRALLRRRLYGYFDGVGG